MTAEQAHAKFSSSSNAFEEAFSVIREATGVTYVSFRLILHTFPLLLQH